MAKPDAIEQWLTARAVNLAVESQKADTRDAPALASALQAEASAMLKAASARRLEVENADKTPATPVVHSFSGDDYGLYVRTRLAQVGRTAADLARATRKSPAQMSRWLNSRIQPGLKNHTLIENALRRFEGE